jgi:integrase/recombinase XerD
MSNTDRELIAELRIVLTRQRYSPVVAGNYCAYAREFVDYLARRGIEITDVTEAQVAWPLEGRQPRLFHGMQQGASRR